MGSYRRKIWCFCMNKKDHLSLVIWGCVLTCRSRLMGGARDDACRIMWASMEQPVERQKCVVGYMGVWTSMELFIFFKRKPRQSGYQLLLMNACCNLNTERPVSHPAAIQRKSLHSLTMTLWIQDELCNPRRQNIHFCETRHTRGLVGCSGGKNSELTLTSWRTSSSFGIIESSNTLSLQDTYGGRRRRGGQEEKWD